MPEQNENAVEEFTSVQSLFVRGRNCLLLQADFSPLFVGYYLHLMQYGLRNAEREDSVLKQLLAYFTLHLVSRPWQEYHAWTLNVLEPGAASYFVCGSSLTEDVTGHVFTEGIREPECNMLYAQNLRPNKDPQTSVITIPGADVAGWVESFYRQSEQRAARAFMTEGDTFALLTAQPDADLGWLESLTAEDVSAISRTEETKLLETRKFRFHCGCSPEKILPTVRAMRKDFADVLSEQGFLTISCPRCGASYNVTAEQL